MKYVLNLLMTSIVALTLQAGDGQKKIAFCTTAARQLIQQRQPEAYTLPGCQLPKAPAGCEAQLEAVKKAGAAWQQSPGHQAFKSAFEAYNTAVNQTEAQYFSTVKAEKENHDAAIKESSTAHEAAIKSAKDTWKKAIDDANETYAQARHAANKPHEQNTKHAVKVYNDAVKTAGKTRTDAIGQAWTQFKAQRPSWTNTPGYKAYKKAFDALQACHKTK